MKCSPPADSPRPQPCWGSAVNAGRSFNPNICGHCGHQASWYTLESVVIAAFHTRPRVPIASAAHPVESWRDLMDLVRMSGCWHVGR
ncbi:hypothetical protein ACIGO9_29900 [Nocardia asteroides]|uniref:hypothetical protein n=1 Tax=Nocardia asteroides TaxID=1824 RepID=UPI0037CA4393